MLEVKNLLMRFNVQLLFEDVNLKLTRGNRYGLIGANGAGKSTFLKILAGEIEANSGEIVIENGPRVGVLGQDQFAFENFSVKDAVLYGNKRLYDAVKEKEQLYISEEFTDAVNDRLAQLEMISAEEDPSYEELQIEPFRRCLLVRTVALLQGLLLQLLEFLLLPLPFQKRLQALKPEQPAARRPESLPGLRAPSVPAREPCS